jgi:hypothetical protein
MAPCGEQMCVDIVWYVKATNELSGEATLALPLPDQSAWQLTAGGYMTAWIGGVSYWGTYDTTYPVTFNTIVGIKANVAGANGQELLHVDGAIGYICWNTPPFPPVVCGDSVTFPGAYDSPYAAIADDPAFAGPLTIRYAFDKTNLGMQPLSETSRFELEGNIHLAYSPVPEPSTGLLVMAGLLGLAYRQRGRGRAPN